MESEDLLKMTGPADQPSVSPEGNTPAPERKRSVLMKIPFIGLILILVKNIFAGVSDIVIKDMTNIDPISLIFFRSTVMLCLEIPWSIVKDQPPFPPGLTVRERVLQVLRWRSSH